MPAGALAAPAFLVLARLALAIVAAAAAEAATFLLVPGAERLAAKRQIFILDDGGLDPGVGIEFDLAGGGVEGAKVRDEIVVVGRDVRRCGRHHGGGGA